MTRAGMIRCAGAIAVKILLAALRAFFGLGGIAFTRNIPFLEALPTTIKITTH